MNGDLDLDLINSQTGGFSGTYDVGCPLCGPDRRSPINRRRKVLRIWIVDGFATYCCARCGEHGFVRDRTAPPPDPAKLARIRAEAAEREHIAVAEQLKKACWLWSRRRPIFKTIAEVYLRSTRCYSGPLPATLGYLPPRGEHGPAMIAAFGLPIENGPGELLMRDEDVRGVHLTRLAPDGNKADVEEPKITIGKSSVGYPIVLAPVNDGLGLAVTEGIENGLSVHEATGLGVWAAGCASRVPALAAAIPSTIEAVTVYADDDDTGQDNARKLAEVLASRVEVSIVGLKGVTSGVEGHCP